jgi:hypothetical protein
LLTPLANSGKKIAVESGKDKLAYYGAMCGLSLVLDRKRASEATATHKLTIHGIDGKVYTCNYDAKRGWAIEPDGVVVDVGPALREMLAAPKKAGNASPPNPRSVFD